MIMKNEIIAAKPIQVASGWGLNPIEKGRAKHLLARNPTKEVIDITY